MPSRAPRWSKPRSSLPTLISDAFCRNWLCRCRDLDVAALKLYLDEVLVAEQGGRASSYREEDGQRVMQQSDITIRVVLGRGTAKATLWTCDSPTTYVK